MYSLGLDIGSCSINLSLLDKDNVAVCNRYELHKGKIRETLDKLIREIQSDINPEDIVYGSIVGSGQKLFSAIKEITLVNEAAALVEGCKILCPSCESIIEIGGQSSKYISGVQNETGIEISMNSSCSAGTGSFLEEQVSRLELKLEDYSAYVSRAETIPRIAGRCSVFAKTDITHHQQEGASVEDILLGLAYAVVKNYRGAVIKRYPKKAPFIFVGGVANNLGIITALKDVLALNDSDLIIPENSGNAGSVGAAFIARQKNSEIDFKKLAKMLCDTDYDYKEEEEEEEEEEMTLPPLMPFGKDDGKNKHSCTNPNPESSAEKYYMGVDIGSTSTNVVVINKSREVVAYEYVRTNGNPARAVGNAFSSLEDRLGPDLKIAGAGITGSGRYMIGELIGADVVKDEITAQARASAFLNKDVDTVFEIGGQDSKFISINNGKVIDFQMNKICAAGTGSFIEEQSKKFNIPVDDFGDIALRSSSPIGLGERCTVFIETSISSNLSCGAKLEDIASGLCYSIVKNYLNRVVGQKKIGRNILLQGGIAYNQGIVNAFRALTGKNIIVPPFFSVTGAYGAAIMAAESVKDDATKFKGFKITENSHAVERVKGFKPEISSTDRFNAKVEDLIFDGYRKDINPDKETVGIPRALFTYGMFPMFSAIFKALGFNVLLSDPTSERTIQAGQEYSQDETCYPIKLINGHIADLIEKGVNYIFFPDLHTVDHPDSKTRQNYGCAYMQLAFKIVNQAMSLKEKGIKLLAPTIAFNRGQSFMMQSFADMGKMLGKTAEETQDALRSGMQAAMRFEERLVSNGETVWKKLNPNKKTFVIISKIYGVADPVLNMGIPGRLTDMGYQVIPFYDLPEGDTSVEHPNMFWPFGQHILEPAKIIEKHPNMYAIFLTHHCCGPDSVLSHFFSEIMGDKPYLNIEVDEHSSDVGVITRIEAFINSLGKDQEAGSLDTYMKSITYNKPQIRSDFSGFDRSKTIFLPNLYPYDVLFKELLRSRGYKAQIFERTNKASINEGRRHTLTNEYLSLTALLGDVFTSLQNEKMRGEAALLIPQSEGAEVGGQYSRLVRTKLDKAAFNNVEVISPFLEDLLKLNAADIEAVFNTLLLGDLVLLSPIERRDKILNEIVSRLEGNTLTIDFVAETAEVIFSEIKKTEYEKRVLAIGELQILFNSFMNNHTFAELNEKNISVVYAPLCEYMWLFWSDFLKHCDNSELFVGEEKLQIFKDYIGVINSCLQEFSPFAGNLEELSDAADKTVGLYAGAFGRYREAKILCGIDNIDGIITVSSTYENTGIVLDILQKGFSSDRAVHILNLTFDGNKNENDEKKVESFIYYL